MRTLPKNWRGKLRTLGCSNEDIRRAQNLVRLARDEKDEPLAAIREDYPFEIYDVARRLKKYREQDAADPEVHTRPKQNRVDWRVSLDFCVGGIWGRETYVVHEKTANDALSRAWNQLHWEAVDLELVGIRDKAIARVAHVGRVEPSDAQKEAAHG
jgi:hypothetical protein